MTRLTPILFVTGLLSAAGGWAQAPAPDTASYRATADVRLQLSFQGIAEGGLSRGLRLFGARGHCQAWYLISEVLATPANLAIRDGQRLKLEYACGEDRAYASETQAPPLNWAEVSDGTAAAWLHSADIVPEREQTWVIKNPENRLAPVAIQPQE